MLIAYLYSSDILYILFFYELLDILEYKFISTTSSANSFFTTFSVLYKSTNTIQVEV